MSSRYARILLGVNESEYELSHKVITLTFSYHCLSNRIAATQQQIQRERERE